MGAQDLMLNDLVLFNNKACKIVATNAYRDCVELYDVDDEDNEVVGKYAKHIEPIPLTAEILEKNMFKFKKRIDGYIVDLRSDRICVILGEHYSVFGYSHLCGVGTEHVDVEYCSEIDFVGKMSVHELQHALRLCGLTELADNFKV